MTLLVQKFGGTSLGSIERIKAVAQRIKTSKDNGNDLITPKPEYNFEGLKDGDCWCVCAVWFKRAVEKGANAITNT